MSGSDLRANPLHLGLGARVTVEPAFTGDMRWFDDYVERHRTDGHDGRLVMMGSYSADWPMWEMHPNGAEVVICTAGAVTLRQERPDGSAAAVELGPGQCAINEAGTWHTADVAEQATLIFITSGIGTQHRPR